jgi:hypothetical protein
MQSLFDEVSFFCKTKNPKLKKVEKGTFIHSVGGAGEYKQILIFAIAERTVPSAMTMSISIYFVINLFKIKTNILYATLYVWMHCSTDCTCFEDVPKKKNSTIPFQQKDC